jgi:hypothetical protein
VVSACLACWVGQAAAREGKAKLRAELSRLMSSGKDGDVWVVYI